MKYKTETTAVSAFAGAVLSIIGYQSARMLGSKIVVDSNSWTMSPFYAPSAASAYIWFAVFMLWGSGCVAGLAIPIYAKKRAVPMFLGAMAGTALGFNTFDWMLAGPIYDASQITSYSVAWNYYFTHIILCLWFGGFMIGLAGGLFWQDDSKRLRK